MAETIIYTEDYTVYTDETVDETTYLDECEWKTIQNPDGLPLEDDIDK